MKSGEPGKNISAAEVTSISDRGFGLRLDKEELFVPYAEFPWFAGATAAKIRQVERPSADHLYWPALDIDLSVQSIRRPQDFPLVSRKRS